MKNQCTAGKFTKAESRLHNVTAVLFIALLVTGGGMLCCNFEGDRGDFRCICKQTHQLLSLLFLIIPPVLIASFTGRIWRDLVLLRRLKGRSAHHQKPEEQRFNSGQKLWANLVVIGSLALGISGAVMWNVHSPILAMVIHIITTLLLFVMLFGHVAMVVIHRRNNIFAKVRKV